MTRGPIPLVLLLGLAVGGGFGFFLGRLTSEGPWQETPRDSATLEPDEGRPTLVGTGPPPEMLEGADERLPQGPMESAPEGLVVGPRFDVEEVTIRGLRPASEPDDRPRVRLEPGTRHGHLLVPDGHVLELSEGTYYVDGDVEVGNNAAVQGPDATVVFDGSRQSVSGAFTAGRVRMSGKWVRIVEGASLSTRASDSDPMTPELYVERGTTLIVETGATVRAMSDYGYQVAGELLIEGGSFHSRFANGNGKTTGRSWLEGSRLTIRSGKFIGEGDHDFRGASILIEGGSLEINDDLWHLGDVFRMDGGMVRNSTWGGAFGVSGRVDLRGGLMLVHQSGNRGLAVSAAGDLFATGGRVEIRGADALDDPGGMALQGDVVLHDLHVASSTRIRSASSPSASLDIRGDLTIAPGKRLDANDRFIDAVFRPTDEQGTLVR